MPFKFFLIPVQASQAAEDEMNTFIRGHTVLHVERRLVEQGSSSFWSCCVEFLDAPARSGGSHAGKRPQVDYREVLADADFAVYAQLRELRKELAQAEQVPAYQVFNNQQLRSYRPTRIPALPIAAGWTNLC